MASLCFGPKRLALLSHPASDTSSADRSRLHVSLQSSRVLIRSAFSDYCSLLESGSKSLHGHGVASSTFNRQRGGQFHRLVGVSRRMYKRAFSSSQFSSLLALNNVEYQFRDEGSDLDLRLLWHYEDGSRPLTAKYISVDAQESSLKVAAQTLQGVRTLLAASRLYGRIKPSETVWFVDEEEIVISLKKADRELLWPGLLEDWENLCLGVPKMLKGTSVYIVGHRTDINWAVAREVAGALRYTPIQTKQLIEEITKHSIIELGLEEGTEGVVKAEDTILATLNTHVRITVATLGGEEGVAASTSSWKHLHGGITIWLAESKAQDERAAQEEAIKAKNEGITTYSKADVIVALGGWETGSAKSAAEGCLRALKCLLDADKELPSKKSLYVRLGCRGDWPNIMPPGWDPETEKANSDIAIQAGVP